VSHTPLNVPLVKLSRMPTLSSLLTITRFPFLLVSTLETHILIVVPLLALGTRSVTPVIFKPLVGLIVTALSLQVLPLRLMV